MKLAVPSVALAASLLAACSATPMNLDPQADAVTHQQIAFDSWAVASVRDAAVSASVLEQHALYPYHFAPNSPALTELGQRDLSILADAYKENPGPLTLVKADTPDDLYNRRKDAIASALQQAGVPADKVIIADGIPGGPGMTGNEAVMSRKAKKDSFGPSVSDTGSVTITDTPVGGNQ